MRVLIISFIIVVIDQITKLLVKGISIPSLGINFAGIPKNSSIEVIPNVFKITFIENPGMAFGLELVGKLPLTLFTIVATLVIIFLIYKNRYQSLYLRISLAFILGGAIGNLIDRTFYGVIFGYAPLFYGQVVDFFHFNIPDITILGKHLTSWPIFNVADISVSTGFILIILRYKKLFPSKEESEAKEEPADIITTEKNIETVENSSSEANA
ncbi:MAG: signal peptidase II [Ignavibacteria bacterium]